ncbi:MAG: hypothetical protein J6N78_02065 [Clostridia bacterium]|nr:hypothetical protein [Clostridia bacterium]
MKTSFGQREIASFKSLRKALDLNISKEEKLTEQINNLTAQRDTVRESISSYEQPTVEQTGRRLSELIIKTQTTTPAGLKQTKYVINPEVLEEVKVEGKAPVYKFKETVAETPSTTENTEETLPETL